MFGADETVDSNALGLTEPIPHFFVFGGTIKKHEISTLAFPAVKDYYDLVPGSKLKMTLKTDDGEPIDVDVEISDTNGDGKISAGELVAAIDKAIREAVRNNKVAETDISVELMQIPVLLRWGDIATDTWHFVLLWFKSKYRLKFDGKVADALELNKEYFDYPDGMKEAVAVHEIGHVSYNAGGGLGFILRRAEPLDYLENIERLSTRYHIGRLSEHRRSVSTYSHYSFSKFLPLICRDYRCSIFRFFGPDSAVDEPGGDIIGDW